MKTSFSQIPAAASRFAALGCALSVVMFLTAFVTSPFADAAEAPVTVYSARNEQLLKPLLDEFTRQTGRPVQLLTASEAALLARLNAEGSSTPADVLITVDAGNLWQATQQKLLQPLTSAALEQAIPPHLRDPERHWFGLSVRARTIVYAKNRVSPRDLSTYENLATPAWRGKLCLRTSKKVYNQSLVAMLLAEYGEARTEAMVRGWVANLATDVFADDTSLLKAIAAGQCQVGIVNTYYLGRLLVADPAFPVGLFWADQTSGGVHINVSGAGITRHAKNRAGAQQLIEFLASETAQKIYTDKDLEYPANPRVNADSVITAWGSFKAYTGNVARAGELQGAATRLMDRTGYK